MYAIRSYYAEARGSDITAEAFLRKPYELTELLDTVREVLSGHA